MRKSFEEQADYVSVEQCCVESSEDVIERVGQPNRVSVEQCCVERTPAPRPEDTQRRGFRRTVLCGKFLGKVLPG